jgi:hypothetical protein
MSRIKHKRLVYRIKAELLGESITSVVAPKGMTTDTIRYMKSYDIIKEVFKRKSERETLDKDNIMFHYRSPRGLVCVRRD